MSTVGFTDKQIDETFTAIAAIMHIGNIEFSGARSRQGCHVSESSSASVAHLVRLLALDPTKIEKGLTTRLMKVGVRNILRVWIFFFLFSNTFFLFHFS